MIHFTMVLEDLVLTATFRQIPEVGMDCGIDSIVSVVDIHVCDGLTGESGKAIWTKDQWLAVHLLIANADEDKLSELGRFYKIAEPAIAMLPQSCRPIP